MKFLHFLMLDFHPNGATDSGRIAGEYDRFMKIKDLRLSLSMNA